MLSTAEVRPKRANIAMNPGERKLAALLGCVLMLVIFLEGFTRLLHNHRQITTLVEQSIGDALAIRHKNSLKQVLFAGNSLIYMDVNQSALQNAMGSRYLVHTTGVNGSKYCDWEYGLRALFQRGSQPDVLVFAISPSQFLREAAVSPVIVSQLWRNQEIFAYRRDQKITLSMFSELILERYSTFFALRDIVRIYVRKIIPGFSDLVGVWARPTPSKPTENQTPGKAVFLEKLAALSRQVPANTQFVLLIPPTNQPNDTAAEPYLREAARQLGIPVEEPVGEYQWPTSKFQPDAYHLNQRSAVEYSHIVGVDVARLADSRPTGSMVADDTMR